MREGAPHAIWGKGLFMETERIPLSRDLKDRILSLFPIIPERDYTNNDQLK